MYKCRKCGKEFKTQNGLKNHWQEEHDIDEPAIKDQKTLG
ncbi:MAG: C2H2-type zinc finger protein [Candidatus Aenigmatarchaeota archaeon]